MQRIVIQMPTMPNRCPICRPRVPNQQCTRNEGHSGPHCVILTKRSGRPGQPFVWDTSKNFTRKRL